MTVARLDRPPARLRVPARPHEASPGLLEFARGHGLAIRACGPRECVFRQGQRRRALFIVRSGHFRSSQVSPDGRERITGFPMRGDLLGAESLDHPCHASQAIALDDGEVWELDPEGAGWRDCGLDRLLADALAAALRQDRQWMLAMGTLSADRRLARFLLQASAREQEIGLAGNPLDLAMTRAELGSFLALQLETITRSLTRLRQRGLIDVLRREVRLRDTAGLQALAGDGTGLAASASTSLRHAA